MAKVTTYKIRHKLTGMYRKAGGAWSKTGRVWANIGHVKNHLNCWRHGHSGALPADSVNWEVVVVEVEEIEAKKIEISELWK